MQNTKTEYSSSERTPVVSLEMEQLLPPLNAEQFSAFESDILENGCYAPIAVNEDTIAAVGDLLQNEILPRDWRLHER